MCLLDEIGLVKVNKIILYLYLMHLRIIANFKAIKEVNMKKIGIVTLIGNFNFGNRLQNYALQEVINDLGYVAETFTLQEEKKYLKKYIKRFIILLSHIIKNNKRINSICRTYTIEMFTDKYIKQSKYSIPIERKLESEYYGIVVGSDQVWNPNYNLPDDYLITFCSNCLKISYAASLGVAEISNDYKKKLVNHLENFNAISVREKSAKQILERNSNIKVEHVLDPTFLICKKNWLKFCNNSKINSIKKKYILLYFLGEVDGRVKEVINELSKDNDYQIIDMMNTKYQKYYNISPIDFVQLINNCEIFFTDSFHGCVFSIILNKLFVCCERTLNNDGDMKTRLTSLLAIFNLDERNFSNLLKSDSWFNEIKYDSINKILDERVKESMDFLKKALNNQYDSK